MPRTSLTRQTAQTNTSFKPQTVPPARQCPALSSDCARRRRPLPDPGQTSSGPARRCAQTRPDQLLCQAVRRQSVSTSCARPRPGRPDQARRQPYQPADNAAPARRQYVSFRRRTARPGRPARRTANKPARARPPSVGQVRSGSPRQPDQPSSTSCASARQPVVASARARQAPAPGQPEQTPGQTADQTKPYSRRQANLPGTRSSSSSRSSCARTDRTSFVSPDRPSDQTRTSSSGLHRLPSSARTDVVRRQRQNRTARRSSTSVPRQTDQTSQVPRPDVTSSPSDVVQPRSSLVAHIAPARRQTRLDQTSQTSSEQPRLRPDKQLRQAPDRVRPVSGHRHLTRRPCPGRPTGQTADHVSQQTSQTSANQPIFL